MLTWSGWPNKTYPVSGTLALNVSVHGSQLNPVGQGTLTVTKAKVSTEPIQNLNVKFEGDGNTVKANLTVQMPAGSARADGIISPRLRDMTRMCSRKISGWKNYRP